MERNFPTLVPCRYGNDATVRNAPWAQRRWAAREGKPLEPADKQKRRSWERRFF
jgi:hypothetical protein